MSKIKNAYGKRNGIVFYSNEYPQIVIDTYVENGEIKTCVDELDFSKFKKQLYGNLDKKRYYSIIKLSNLIDIILIILSIFTLKINLILASVFFSFTISNDLFKFLYQIYNIKFGKMKSTGRYRAAGYMAINAYNKLNRVPTVKEIRKFSRFSKNCEYEMKIRDIIIFVSFTILIALNLSRFSVWFSFIYPFLVILMIIDIKYSIFRVFQILITNKPTKLELKIAINGIEEFEKYEKDIKEFKEKYPNYPPSFMFILKK